MSAAASNSYRVPTPTAMRHLLSRKHVDVEDRTAIEAALSHYDAGLDFADALHHASYRRCEAIASFDDRKARSGSDFR